MDSDEDDYFEAAQRTAKQKFLREEIMEVGYSAD